MYIYTHTYICVCIYISLLGLRTLADGGQYPPRGRTPAKFFKNSLFFHCASNGHGPRPPNPVVFLKMTPKFWGKFRKWDLDFFLKFFFSNFFFWRFWIWCFELEVSFDFEVLNLTPAWGRGNPLEWDLEFFLKKKKIKFFFLNSSDLNFFSIFFFSIFTLKFSSSVRLRIIWIFFF